MTKQELLNTLATKFYLVPTPELISDNLGVKEYRIFPWTKETDKLYKQYVGFCVEHEGEGNEVAYWSPQEPKPTVVQTFTDKALSYIKDKITDGTIKYGYLVSTDNTIKKGLGVAITPANLKKDVLIVEDTGGVLSITIL